MTGSHHKCTGSAALSEHVFELAVPAPMSYLSRHRRYARAWSAHAAGDAANATVSGRRPLPDVRTRAPTVPSSFHSTEGHGVPLRRRSRPASDEFRDTLSPDRVCGRLALRGHERHERHESPITRTQTAHCRSPSTRQRVCVVGGSERTRRTLRRSALSSTPVSVVDTVPRRRSM